MESRLRRRMVVLGLAATGVVAGHAAGYAIAFPGESLRRQILAQTGHGWLSWGTLLAAGIGFMAAAAIFVAGSRRMTSGRGTSLYLQLATLQVTGFLAIEAAERLASHHPHGPGWRAVWIGVLVQLLVAAANVLLSRTAHSAGRVLAARRGTQWPTRALRISLPESLVFVRPAPGSPGARGRAPPFGFLAS
ncbi:MAG TPA: hypothetical protein VNE62_10915 [Actinomycetota bacterium]|nr:hypothetical protein [Actinomycetota bacterium]